jgi:hypothetical protein
VEAVREAMGDDHAGKVAKMGKADAVKFAIGNVARPSGCRSSCA